MGAKLRTGALLSRAALRKRINRLAEAQKDFLLVKNIPARDPKAGLNLIDLSAHYNASLTEDWHAGSGFGNYSQLPRVKGFTRVGEEPVFVKRRLNCLTGVPTRGPKND